MQGGVLPVGFQTTVRSDHKPPAANPRIRPRSQRARMEAVEDQAVGIKRLQFAPKAGAGVDVAFHPEERVRERCGLKHFVRVIGLNLPLAPPVTLDCGRIVDHHSVPEAPVQFVEYRHSSGRHVLIKDGQFLHGSKPRGHLRLSSRNERRLDLTPTIVENGRIEIVQPVYDRGPVEVALREPPSSGADFRCAHRI